MVNFKVSKDEMVLIHAIAKKAADKFGYPLMDIDMDITACHANGNPLKLKELLCTDDFNFAHDVCGIRQHIDRKTGELMNCFLPRFSV